MASNIELAATRRQSMSELMAATVTRQKQQANELLERRRKATTPTERNRIAAAERVLQLEIDSVGEIVKKRSSHAR